MYISLFVVGVLLLSGFDCVCIGAKCTLFLGFPSLLNYTVSKLFVKHLCYVHSIYSHKKKMLPVRIIMNAVFLLSFSSPGMKIVVFAFTSLIYNFQSPIINSHSIIYANYFFSLFFNTFIAIKRNNDSKNERKKIKQRFRSALTGLVLLFILPNLFIVFPLSPFCY